MGVIETDYLVVGAGVSGLAFVDSLIRAGDAEVLMVDKRHRPGGHWIDCYPFVRLHQPSATYGVASRRLGADKIDDTGPNAGFYERARGAEIAVYFGKVLDEDLQPTGRVSFQGLTEYRGHDADGHHLVSLLTGAETTVRVRRKLVDATYVESDIPSRHTPQFGVGDGVSVVPPNALVDLADAPGGFTVVGAGKTAMDTCNWLLDEGVDPDRIRWVKPQDGWYFNREVVQPLEKVGRFMQMQGEWVGAAAVATDGLDFFRRLEAADVFLRIDPDVEPTAYRGATISKREVAALRGIERVVRKGRISAITADRVVLAGGEEPGHPDELYVDCTAAGVRATQPRPIFEPDRITLQYVLVGQVPYGAATQGFVEAVRDDDAEKNRLCPPVAFTGRAADILDLVRPALTGTTARRAEPDLADWDSRCRLNPGAAAREHLDDPQVANAIGAIMANIGPAFANLARRTETVAAT